MFDQAEARNIALSLRQRQVTMTPVLKIDSVYLRGKKQSNEAHRLAGRQAIRLLLLGNDSQA